MLYLRAESLRNAVHNVRVHVLGLGGFRRHEFMQQLDDLCCTISMTMTVG